LKTRLLGVQGPTQFIAAYIAMEWYRQEKGEESDYQTVLLMYDFLMPANSEQDFVEVIHQLASIGRWKKSVFISSEKMSGLMSGIYIKRINRLHQLLGESEFDEVYLSRDFSSPGSTLILNSYPSATRITYGDSLGIVGNYLTRRSGIRPLLSYCKTLAENYIYGQPQKLPFDTAALVLPIDWSGEYLTNMALMVTQRDFVLNIFQAIGKKLDRLNEYSEALLKKTKCDKNYLILLSNLTLSGFTSVENEISLYIEIVEKNVPKEATVFLKAHPRGGANVIKGVAESLEKNYEVKVLDDLELAKLPIELWGKLTSNSTVIPVFSTSSINMKYLSGGEVLLPLTEELIDKYFVKNQISRMKKANRVINEAVVALNDWDGASVLWRPDTCSLPN
jgi:hypothetical protein